MDLVTRLKSFMEISQIAISQFADTCNIPRPTMSQILNGRNKKISDELISKIHQAYPQLSVLWLMFGEGDMLVDMNIQISEAKNDENIALPNHQSADSQQLPPAYSGISAPTETESNKCISQNQPSNTTPPLDFGQAQQSPSPTKSTQHTDHNTDYGIIDFGTATSSDNTTNNDYTKNMENDSHWDSFQMHDSAIKNDGNTAETPDEAPHIIESETADKSTATPSSQNIAFQTFPGKQITNIVVFYSDNSFQSFHPETFTQQQN